MHGPQRPGRWGRWLALLLLAGSVSEIRPGHSQDAIPRVLPPAGQPLPDDVAGPLRADLERLRQGLQSQASHPLSADVEVYLKALDLALAYDEFYGPKDTDKARFLIAEAQRRLPQLAAPSPDWIAKRGLTVRGYRSRLDGSVQPYGVVLPAELDLSRPVPLYVWLHGRGDKQTDLHFIHERHHAVGQIAPPHAIVIHPFGRHCLGFKSAGEIDVLEAVEHACAQYPIDPQRIVLAGFSMGGAGAWHLGAHYADRWCAVSPGAGFAETAQYNRLTPERYPPSYEQALWGCYDVPAYVRNLFNVPVIAYSGENDKQIQAARVMEAAFLREGRELRHLIGPGVEHRYEPATLRQLLAELADIDRKGRTAEPTAVTLQTRTLRYAKLFWLEARGLEQHWQEARLDARLSAGETTTVDTRGVTSFRLQPPAPTARLVVDGQTVKLPAVRLAAGQSFTLERPAGGNWRVIGDEPANPATRRKRPGLQGPIDDAFLDPFLFVVPSGTSSTPLVDRWVQRELAHARERWRAVCRGEVRVKKDVEVTAEDIAAFHLVLWGDIQSNRLLAQLAGKLPVQWAADQLILGQQRWPASEHMPVLIYPNPLQPARYVVLNSGLTFREAHDRTNSQQNPKLPDWAIIDLRQPPNDQTPGRVAAAGFFNESWE
ncbi:MAG: prolyl oligopeptidase family serine peptidase [Pirellulales bacterium]